MRNDFEAKQSAMSSRSGLIGDAQVDRGEIGNLVSTLQSSAGNALDRVCSLASRLSPILDQREASEPMQPQAGRPPTKTHLGQSLSEIDDILYKIDKVVTEVFSKIQI